MKNVVFLAAMVAAWTCWAAGIAQASPVALTNPSFEDPAGPKTVGDATWSNIPGWTSSGPSNDSGIELFNAMPQPLLGANIAFLQSGDGSIFQTTARSLAAGDIYTLSFYERNDYNATQLTATLYYLDGATRTPFASMVFSPLTNVGRSGVLTQRTLTSTLPVPALGIGKSVGVELVNSSNNGGTGTWAWVDLVTLDVVPEPTTFVLLLLGIVGALGRRRSF